MGTPHIFNIKKKKTGYSNNNRCIQIDQFVSLQTLSDKG